MSLDPSESLLRTLAAVPVSSSVLDLGCGHGRHTEPLLRLGFPVHACDPRPEAVEATRARVADLLDEETARSCVREATLDGLDYFDTDFDWIVADRAEAYAATPAELTTLLRTGRRLLAPGGWMFVTLPASAGDGHPEPPDGQFTEAAVEACREDAGLAVARDVERVEGPEGPRLRLLYRRADPSTPS